MVQKHSYASNWGEWERWFNFYFTLLKKMNLNPVFCLTGKRVKWFFTKEDTWMAQKKIYMTWCSTSLLTRKMRIETPIRYHHISTRMLKLKRLKSTIRQSVQPLSQSNFLWPHGLQHARFPCLTPTPRNSSNSCPLSQWCHPTISSSVIAFSSCLQSFWVSGSIPMSQLFTSDGQSTGASASASALQWIFRVDFL